MRRPWLAGGVVIGWLGLLIIALAPNIAVVLLGWCLAQLAYNATLAAITALLPDQVPAEQREGASPESWGSPCRWGPCSAPSWCNWWWGTCC
jgi:MFS family permease